MTEEQWMELGRRAVACKGWRWDMPWCFLPDKHGRVFRRNWCPSDSGFGVTQVTGRRLRGRWDSAQAVPDFRDPATVGCLLALVREAWNTHVVVDRERFGEWLVTAVYQFHCSDAGEGSTEPEALVAALEGAP